MSETKYFKCACAHCGGHIEFPADAAGLSLACPHCGNHTELLVPAPSMLAESATPGAKGLIWALIITVVVAGVALVVLAAVLKNFASRKGAGNKPASSEQRAHPLKTPPPPATTTIATNEFVIADVAIETVAGSSLTYVVGTVRNAAARQRFGVRVELELLDETGRKVGAAQDYLQVMEPKKEWRFKALVIGGNAAGARLTTIREDR